MTRTKQLNVGHMSTCGRLFLSTFLAVSIMEEPNNRMLGMLFCGQLFLLMFLAVSVMDHVVSLAVVKLGRSLRMSGWKKLFNVWCAIDGISFSCFDTVLDSVAAGCNPYPKPVYCLAVPKNKSQRSHGCMC